MTHNLLTVVDALLGPERLYRVAELRDSLTQIPRLSGIYAWWFSKAPPTVSVENTATYESRRLLYVGIAPRKPSAAGSVSGGTLRNRLLNHCRGPLATSTLRRTLAVLLKRELGFDITSTSAGKLRMPPKHETRLTEWMDEHARIVWVVHPEPWEVEDSLIQGTTRLPLNIRGSSDPFAKELTKLRSQIGRKHAQPIGD